MNIKIMDAADRHCLDPSVVYGVCMQESLCNPLAIRYEPDYKWLVKGAPGQRLRPAICSLDTEYVLQKCSLGIMQVMGAVCREYGFRGWLTEILTDIDLQLEYGCRHLAIKIKAYGFDEGILSYNSGSPRKNEAGKYVNQYYLDSVLKYAKEWNDDK